MTPTATRTPVALVLVLHGYGSDAASIDWLVADLAARLPGAAVVALDGLEQAPEGGRRWFDIAGVPESGRGPRVQAAIPAVERRVAEALAAVGLGHGSLALVGFSQGATTALQYAASAATPPRAVVALAGRLAGPIDARRRHRSAILLAHGEADQVIPIREMVDATERLRAAGFNVVARAESGLGHIISPVQVEDAGHFLRGILPGGNPTQEEG